MNTVLNRFLEINKFLLSPLTRETYAFKLKTLLDLGFDPQTCFNSLMADGYNRYTIKIYFIIAGKFEKQMYGTQKFNDWMKANKQVFKNCYQERTKQLKIEQFKKVLNGVKTLHPEFFNFLNLMGRAGLRRNEALNLKWSDIKDGLITIKGKFDRVRQVPSPLLLAVSSKGSEFVVGRSLPYRKLFSRYLPGFSPRDLRAMFITQVANSGTVGIKEVMMLAGHSQVSTTMKYIRLDMESISRKLRNAL